MASYAVMPKEFVLEGVCLNNVCLMFILQLFTIDTPVLLICFTHFV